ncbi:hypothetical protein D3C80_441990 [compost metagenome]|jgi:hypothetical protein
MKGLVQQSNGAESMIQNGPTENTYSLAICRCFLWGRGSNCLNWPLVAAAVRLRSGVKRPQDQVTAIRQVQRGARVATALQSIAASYLGSGYSKCCR